MSGKSSDTLFAEWYAVQKGLIDFGERLKEWKFLRNELESDKSKLDFSVGKLKYKYYVEEQDSKTVAKPWPEVCRMKIVWPTKWVSVSDKMVFEIGVNWTAQMLDGEGRYKYEEMTFWQTTYYENHDEEYNVIVTPNQNIQQHPTKRFIPTQQPTIIQLCGPRPSAVIIKAIHKDTSDTICTFQHNPPVSV